VKVAVLYERSGIVRDAFAALGHDAASVDLEPSERSGPHFVEDALHWLSRNHVDLAIAHPPCTYLSVSGLHWNHRRPERAALTEVAVRHFLDLIGLLNESAGTWAIENPVGCMSKLWRKPNQIIQPHQFGHDASKATCLWLKNLPLLRPTKQIPPIFGCECGTRFPLELGKHGCPNCRGDGRVRRIWGNQTPTGQNRLGPSAKRAMDRARTYPGIAEAMAFQWGRLISAP
jgi:hypothetical protein